MCVREIEKTSLHIVATKRHIHFVLSFYHENVTGEMCIVPKIVLFFLCLSRCAKSCHFQVFYHIVQLASNQLPTHIGLYGQIFQIVSFNLTSDFSSHASSVNDVQLFCDYVLFFLCLQAIVFFSSSAQSW